MILDRARRLLDPVLEIERSEDRDAALRAALPHVPALGWTRAALAAGLQDAGGDPLLLDSLFPRGPIEAVEAWRDLADREMAGSVPADLAERRIPARIRALIALRLEQSAPHREALQRAAALLALPWNAPSALRIAARSADAIWNAAGDQSADLSHHTRRATLAAIHASVVAFWLTDRSEGARDTLAFLDRQLGRLARLQRQRRPARLA